MNIIGSFKYWLNSDGIVTLAKSLKTGRWVPPKLIQAMLDQQVERTMKQVNKSVISAYSIFTVFTTIFLLGCFYALTRQHHGHVSNDVSLAKQFLVYAVVSLFGMILSQKDE